MSFANLELVSCLPPMLTLPSCPSNASVMIRSKNTLNSTGESRHPCLTPTLVLNHSPIDPLWKTALGALTYRLLIKHIMRSWMILYSVAHSAACHTRSNTLLKSMKTWYRCRWWCAYLSHKTLRLNVCSSVIRRALNPACYSASIASACGFSLFRITFSITLLMVRI